MAAATKEPGVEDLTYPERIMRLVLHYDPSKGQATKNTITKFAGKERGLFNSLVTKYGAEQPLKDHEKKMILERKAKETPPPPSSAAAVPASAPAATGSPAAKVRPAAPSAPASPTKTPVASPATADAAAAAGVASPTAAAALAEADKNKKDADAAAAKLAAEAKQKADEEAAAKKRLEEEEAAKKKAQLEADEERRKTITINDMPFEDRIRRHVARHEPDKLDTVAPSLIEYKGKEKALLESFVSKTGAEAPLTPEEIENILHPPPPPPPASPEKDGTNNKEPEPTKPPEPNPFQDAFDIQPRPPSPRQPTVAERITRMMVHYDPKSQVAVETALSKDPEKGQALLDSLVQSYGPEPDYSRTIVPWDEHALLLATIPENEQPKSFGELYSRIMRIVEVKDPSSVDNLHITLEAFRGREMTLLRALMQKYGGEPPLQTDVSIADSDDIAARFGVSQQDTQSGTSSRGGSTGGLAGYGAVVGPARSNWVMNAPPPPPMYSGFARMAVGKLNQETNRNDPLMISAAPAPGAAAAAAASSASPRGAGGVPAPVAAVGAAAAATTSPTPTSFPAGYSPFYPTPTPPPGIAPPDVDPLVFANPVRDIAVDAKVSKDFKGWGRAADKPICERFYYSPAAARVRPSQVPAAPMPKIGSASGGGAGKSEPQESEEDRKKRLQEQIRARPAPPPAKILKGDVLMFSSAVPVAKMDDVDHELATIHVLEKLRVKCARLERKEEPAARAALVAEKNEWFEQFDAKREREKKRALQRLEQRMAGHIQSISARYAFKPETQTYSPEERLEDETGVLVHRMLDSEEDNDDEATERVVKMLNPLEGEEAVELMLSERQNFLMAVLPEGALKSRQKKAIITRALAEGRSMREAVAEAGRGDPSFIVEMRSPPSWQFRARLGRFVRKYIPQALDDVNAVAQDHVGKEESLMAFLRAKYGPEPGTIDDGVMAGIDRGDIILPDSPALAEQSHALIDQPVMRSLAELEDFMFAPGDRPRGLRSAVEAEYEYQTQQQQQQQQQRHPDFAYQGVPPEAPPTLDDELRELRRAYYKEQPHLLLPERPGFPGEEDDCSNSNNNSVVYMMAPDSSKPPRGLNAVYEEEEQMMKFQQQRNGGGGHASDKTDPRLKEVNSLLQAVEASSNALMTQDPRWMGEENVPRAFWDIVEHRPADDDDAIIMGTNNADLTQRLNAAAKLGVPQEEFMRIERERAEKRRKERERNARELRDAKQRVHELEEQQAAAVEEARNARAELEQARREAEEKIAAANRRLDDARTQVQRELRQLDGKEKASMEESVRREQEREAGLAMQRALEEERLKEKENTLNAREREVQLRLEEAQKREKERMAAEAERRKREQEEVEKWKSKAEEKMTPRTSDGVQTDPITDMSSLSPRGLRYGQEFMRSDTEVQMQGSPKGESGTQTRQDLVIIDDPRELKEIFEIKRQTDAGKPLLEAIRESSWENGARSASAATAALSGENSPSRKNPTAETGSQSGTSIVETKTRDVQTPDFASIQMRSRLRLAELEYAEQVERSKMSLLAIESSPRLLARSRESLKPSVQLRPAPIPLPGPQQQQQQQPQLQNLFTATPSSGTSQPVVVAQPQQQQQQQKAASSTSQPTAPAVVVIPSPAPVPSAPAATSSAATAPPSPPAPAPAQPQPQHALPVPVPVAAVPVPAVAAQTPAPPASVVVQPQQLTAAAAAAAAAQSSPEPQRPLDTPSAAAAAAAAAPRPQETQQQQRDRLEQLQLQQQQQQFLQPDSRRGTTNNYMVVNTPNSSSNAPQQTPQPQQQQQPASLAGYVAPESQTYEEYQDRVRIMYKKYVPDKTPVAVDAILNRYHGTERTLLTALALKYGPEPEGAEAQALLVNARKEAKERLAKLAEQQKLKQQQQQAELSASRQTSPWGGVAMAVSPASSVAPNNNHNTMMINNNSSPFIIDPRYQGQQQQQQQQQQQPLSDLHLDPVDFQSFFSQWEIAPVLLPANSSNATPRLAACKLTPEDIFLFPSLEANAARRSVKRQIQTMIQAQQQAILQQQQLQFGSPYQQQQQQLPEIRSPYSEAAITALQDASARCFYFSQVMYWCPPRNPSWKYVAVTGREILVGDDENHLKHRLCLLGSPSEAVALSVILYQGLGQEGDDTPCVVVIRRGTPPVSRVWTADVDPNPNVATTSLHSFPGLSLSSAHQQSASNSRSSFLQGNSNNNNNASGIASGDNQQQQDVVLFFPSGLQARKSNSAEIASQAGARLPVQGRFAALRAQRLVGAIKFAVQSEGPVAHTTSGGGVVSAPISCWTLRSSTGTILQAPAGVDETAFLLERAAKDLCSMRYSGTNAAAPPGALAGALALPAASVPDAATGARSFVDPAASRLVLYPQQQQQHHQQQADPMMGNQPQLTLMELARRQGAGGGAFQQQQQQQPQYRNNEMDVGDGAMSKLISSIDQKEREREHMRLYGVSPFQQQQQPPQRPAVYNNNNVAATPQAQIQQYSQQPPTPAAAPFALTAEALAEASKRQQQQQPRFVANTNSDNGLLGRVGMMAAPSADSAIQQQQQYYDQLPRAQPKQISPAQDVLAKLKRHQASVRQQDGGVGAAGGGWNPQQQQQQLQTPSAAASTPQQRMRWIQDSVRH